MAVITRTINCDAMVHCRTKILQLQKTDPIHLVIDQNKTLKDLDFMSLADQMIKRFTYKLDPIEAKQNLEPHNNQEERTTRSIQNLELLQMMLIDNMKMIQKMKTGAPTSLLVYLPIFGIASLRMKKNKEKLHIELPKTPKQNSLQILLLLQIPNYN